MKLYTTISPALESEVRVKMESSLDVCRAKNPSLTIPTPKLVFRQMGKRAGLCIITSYMTKECVLMINPDFFKNYHDDMVNDTVPHEVAHYVAGFHIWRKSTRSWSILENCHGLVRSSLC